MFHFAKRNQAPPSYSVLQHIARAPALKLVPRNCLRYLQRTLIMGKGIGFRIYVGYCSMREIGTNTLHISMISMTCPEMFCYLQKIIKQTKWVSEDFTKLSNNFIFFWNPKEILKKCVETLIYNKIIPKTCSQRSRLVKFWQPNKTYTPSIQFRRIVTKKL